MKILAFESSCDETAICLMDYQSLGHHQVLAEEILSQTETHVEYGGVVPELAAREHLRNLPILLEKVLLKARCELVDLDFLAVTVAPGLKGCLLTGLSYASGLAEALGKPLLGVNHIEGHLLAAFLNNPELTFPYLALLVSGGHTMIVKVDAVGEYQVLAKTLDDAAGEAFDKSAHLMGFSYPGGPQLAKLADEAQVASHKFPIVMKGSVDFSFSGLKTAISLKIQSSDLNDSEKKGDLARSIQSAIVENLIVKLKKQIKLTGIGTIVVTGGVAANQHLRNEVDKLSPKVFYPDSLHCMDNAAMIALVAAARQEKGLAALETTTVHARVSLA